MAKIDNFSNEIQLSLNHIQSKIFEILAVDNQMVASCGQDEPHKSPKKVHFSCVIGIYLMSFFYEHPVYQIMEKSKIVLAQHKMIATSKGCEFNLCEW